MAKTKTIKFRASEQLESFLKTMTKEIQKTGVRDFTVSDLIRGALEYFFMAYTLGNFDKTLPQLRKEFKSFIASSKPNTRRRASPAPRTPR